MEIQAIEYTCQELLATLQGPALQKITASPALLRRIIASIESLQGIGDYLAETEARLYPNQTPLAGRTRRNKISRIKENVADIDEEQKHARILNFVEKWIATHREAPTLREIRNYNRSRYLTDIKEIVADMVAQGKLKAVSYGRSMRYVIPLKIEGSASAEQAAPIEQAANTEPVEQPTPLTHLQIGDNRIGVWWVTGCYTKDGASAYYLNQDPHSAYLYGSKEYHAIDRWVVKVDDYEHYNLSVELLEVLQGEGK